MKYLIVVALFFCSFAKANSPYARDSGSSVLIIPYNPAMHLSDADIDISMDSEMEMNKMRETMRFGLLKELNKKFAEMHDVKNMQGDFVNGDNDYDKLYHTVLYQSDSTYPKKDPSHFAVIDSSVSKNKKVKPETSYINVQVNDRKFISDMTNKYDSDYIIFLNEIDIKTNFDDCMNLALKIYRRDLKVHYSIFDKNGKQVYGDVAVVHFGSNSNDVNEIMDKNFPYLADYILRSFEKVSK